MPPDPSSEHHAGAVCCKVALGALAKQAGGEGPAGARAVLAQWRQSDPGRAALERTLGEPTAEHPVDAALAQLKASLHLSVAEVLAVALALDVERHPMVSRVLAWLQEPTGGGRPILGLMAEAFSSASSRVAIDELADGHAVATGLLILVPGGGPLPERAIALPSHLLQAVQGKSAHLSGAVPGLSPSEQIPLPATLKKAAERHAAGVCSGGTVVVRSGDRMELRNACTALVAQLGGTPLFLESEEIPGLVPWLHLANLVPVFLKRLSPGERFTVPRLMGWNGPVIVATGPDGAVEAAGGAALSWRLGIPGAQERTALWLSTLKDPELAEELGQAHRHGAGRIAQLGRLARQHAAMAQRTVPSLEDVHAASCHGDGGLETLAEPLRGSIPESALVLGAPLRRELELLLSRCRQREHLVDDLGAAASARYGTGVRALFVGPSGTGKTLAVSWLASRLALPLYRVDMASVMSKYIGETEKNLSDLLARAESAEVILFFDEADSLFGKRTEVRHSTDRFANSQTNYLLQRIESYDGVVVLASNSRTRFDPAFSRRLDQIVEFPLPGPEERRALWQAHLGRAHALTAKELNEFAMACELAGGHIRNAVLSGAVLAGETQRLISREDVIFGLNVEYRKLGKSLPHSLKRRPTVGKAPQKPS